MFAKSILRLSSRVARHNKTKSIVTKPSKSPFVTTTKLSDNPETIAAKEIETTTYTDGHVEQNTLILDQEASASSSGTGAIANALTKSVYNKLPSTMQKLSLMDKVVMVTG